MSRRRRGLSREDRALWDAVARTVAPLRPEDVPPPDIASGPPAPPVVPSPAPAAAGLRAEPKDRRLPAPPPLHPIERRTLSRVARGTMSIDGRIDLHGLTQLDAHQRLRHFLAEAQRRGDRLVLVITGKGRPGSEGEAEERGVLRRRVPHWLAEPGLRGIVIGFEEAHRSHGGGGALYVRIRRRRGGEP